MDTQKSVFRRVLVLRLLLTCPRKRAGQARARKTFLLRVNLLQSTCPWGQELLGPRGLGQRYLHLERRPRQKARRPLMRLRQCYRFKRERLRRMPRRQTTVWGASNHNLNVSRETKLRERSNHVKFSRTQSNCKRP